DCFIRRTCTREWSTRTHNREQVGPGFNRSQGGSESITGRTQPGEPANNRPPPLRTATAAFPQVPGLRSRVVHFSGNGQGRGEDLSDGRASGGRTAQTHSDRRDEPLPQAGGF